MKSILDEIKAIAVKEGWHTLPKDSAENKVFNLSDVIEDYPVVAEEAPKVAKPVKKTTKSKKKGK